MVVEKFIQPPEHQRKQRLRDDHGVLDSDITAGDLFDQLFRRAALDIDTQQLRAQDKDRGVRIANGRMLEAPDGIAWSYLPEE